MQLASASRNSDDNVVWVDERLDHAVVVFVRFGIAVHLQIEHLNHTDTRDLRARDARLDCHHREVLIVRHSEPLHDFLVVEEITRHVFAANHDGRYHARALLNHLGCVHDVGENIGRRVCPALADFSLLRPVKRYRIRYDLLAIVGIALDDSLARGEDVSRHLVLTVDNHVLQVVEVVRLQGGSTLCCRHCAIDILAERTVFDVVWRDDAAGCHDRRLVNINLRALTLRIYAPSARHDERCQLAAALAVLDHDVTLYARRRHDREKSVEQEGCGLLRALHRLHEIVRVVEINRHYVYPLTLLTSRRCRRRAAPPRVRLPCRHRLR